MEEKFERKSKATDLVLPLIVVARPAQVSAFLFGSSWWHGKTL